MGLTIHYRLQANCRSPTKTRRLIEVLRKRALDLPFANVGEVVELASDACNYEKLDQDDPHRWLLIQAGHYVEREGIHFHVKPKHVIAFSTDPGDGCEEANFGLCRYPGIIDITDPRTGHPRKLRTQLTGWCWSSFCKTQYATRHGVEHFLRCHLTVIRMLDIAKELGILASVSDEGDFWEKRDIQALAREVGEWNQGMAALVGKLKDMLGGNIDAPITKFPNFEHLEADGQEPEEA